ncbi:MAG: ParB/RepB/Spo0J family partition protein [Chthonomonadales bacterium]
MLKRGIGRGLEAILGESIHTVSVDRPTLQLIPVDNIIPNQYQPRTHFDEEKIEELTQSIRLHGILQPLLVRPTEGERYELIAGERRWRASIRAGMKSVPAIVRPAGPQETLEVAIIENVQREEINAVDAAIAYSRLTQEFNLTQEEIARRVGKSRVSIANTLRLLGLTPTILDGLREGHLTEGHARAILQARPSAREGLYKETLAKGLSVREAERLARERSAEKPVVERKPRNEPAVDPNHADIEETLSIALGTRVRIRSKGESGTIEIQYYTHDQFEGIYQKLVGEE